MRTVSGNKSVLQFINYKKKLTKTSFIQTMRDVYILKYIIQNETFTI